VEGSSHAGRNGYIKKTHTEGIAAHIPHSTLMIVPSQRHRLLVEDPALFNRLVLEFLTGRKGDL
jgi:pimeloyl-ACP methyl ester carboxylesterase